MKIRNTLLASFVVLFVGFSAQAQKKKNSADQSRFFEGIIRTLIFEGETAGGYRHFLETVDGERLEIALEDERLSGAQVSVAGRLNDKNVIVPEKIEVLAARENVSRIPVAGSRKVLVLLLNYQNDTSQPVPADEVKRKIFTDPLSPNRYFQQSSGNRLRLAGRESADGDVYGYFTLPFNNDYCDSTTIYLECFPAADNLALQQGINVNLYQTVIYLFAGNNPSNFIFADLGYVDDQTLMQRVCFMNFATEFNLSQFQYTVTHEIGHNLGLNHIGGFGNCPTNLPIENCADYLEYADRADVMGYFGYHLLSNYHRLRLGWLDGKVRTYDSPGVFYANLHSPSHPSKGITAIQIRGKDAAGNFTGKSFFLEYRRNLPPFDVFRSGDFPFPPVQLADKGVVIRFGNEDLLIRLARFYTIDGTPETPDFGDAALEPGKAYTNSYYGIKISVIGVNPFFGARVKIELTR